MDKSSKKIIFFLHLNENTMEKNATPIYIAPTSKIIEHPSLLCKMKNNYYKSVYTMYSFDITKLKEDNKLSLILQLKNEMNYPFDIDIPKDFIENKNYLYYFNFEKIIFKDRIITNFFEKLLKIKKDILPPFSCDIHIFEQTQLIQGYINNQNREEQFHFLNALKHQLGFSKFTRFNELFLMYLKVIFEENYNIELIQELLNNYNNINFNIKNSFNFSLFFDSIIKPIFLKSYTNSNFIKYNIFEYDLRNCLNYNYNKLLDKLCMKYYILYDINFLTNENNIITRISKEKDKKIFYEIFYEVIYELNMIKYNDFFRDNNLLSEEFYQKILDLKKIEINNIKQNSLDNKNNIININDFNGLKMFENSIPVYFLGKLNDGYYARSIDDKELYIYDSVLNVRIRVGYHFSGETTSLFKLQDGNIIIVYSNNQKICIIDTQNIYKGMNQIYAFNNLTLNENDINNTQEECILKIIETKNKNLVQLSKNAIYFYYNKNISNEYSHFYDYQKYYEIKQLNRIINFSILEFNDNYIIVCSGIFESSMDDIKFSKNCYLTFINIIKKTNKNNNNKENEHPYIIEEFKEKVIGLFVYDSVFEDNNILIKLNDDIMGIGSKNIYLYSLKNKEIFQIVEIPSISSNIYYKNVSSFSMIKNQIINVAVKYYTEKEKLDNFIIKFYIYVFNESNKLNKENELIFLSESKIDSEQSFFEAREIQY